MNYETVNTAGAEIITSLSINGCRLLCYYQRLRQVPTILSRGKGQQVDGAVVSPLVEIISRAHAVIGITLGRLQGPD